MQKVNLCLMMVFFLVFNFSVFAKITGSWEKSRQMVVVTTPNWTATTGTLQLFERDAMTLQWKKVAQTIPVVVGAAGLGWNRGTQEDNRASPQKREGDKRAPAGRFWLSDGFGYAAQSNSKLPYMQTTEDLKCIDDANSLSYNRIVNQSIGSKDWKSAENMLRKDDLYKWGVVVDYNQQQIRDVGSCIFLHVWRAPDSPTLGCTAMQPEKIKWLQEQLNPERLPMLVQLPIAEYAEYRSAWNLP